MQKHITNISQRRACKTFAQHRFTQRYQTVFPSDAQRRLVKRIHELVLSNPRYGYRRIWALLRAEGLRVNLKRIYRLWRQEGFKVPKKQCKRRNLGSSMNSIMRKKAKHKDHIWNWDFIHD